MRQKKQNNTPRDRTGYISPNRAKLMREARDGESLEGMPSNSTEVAAQIHRGQNAKSQLAAIEAEVIRNRNNR